jgi:isocitrate dehydrogenase
LADTLDQATGLLLDNNKSPERNAGQLDNRGSHFYIALYWAQALASQNEDQSLKNAFAKIASELSSNETSILNELNGSQGSATDIGGYYHPSLTKTSKAMRPSSLLNNALTLIG